MRTFFILTMMGFAALAAEAQIQPNAQETIEIVRSKAVYDLTIDLNAQNVRCLQGDYGLSSLKISIPEMKFYTIFPHTTRGETQPCINAGACETAWVVDGLRPDMILDSSKPTEDIKLTVTLTEILTLNSDRKACERRLQEHVQSHVRGLDFVHLDGSFLGEMDYEVCLKMKEKEAQLK